MSVLQQISFFQGRRDEVPNQELARELVSGRDIAGIQEIAQNLGHENSNVQSDCLKVLYEIGYLDPTLIGDYWQDFVRLLKSKNNRLVWGAMIGLGTIAELKAIELYPHLSLITKAMADGSVITVDNAVKVLAGMATGGEAQGQVIFPILLQHLASCRPKEVPQHSEKSLPAVNRHNAQPFLDTLQGRMADLSPSQATRVRRVMRQAEMTRNS